MTSVAVKGLLGRKTRSILTALAIVLGVAMISGTYVLTDTIKKAFNTALTTSYRHTDAIISGREIVKGANETPSVPTGLLAYYPYTLALAHPWALYAVYSPLAAALLGAGVWAVRRAPLYAFGLAFFVVNIAKGASGFPRPVRVAGEEVSVGPFVSDMDEEERLREREERPQIHGRVDGGESGE